MKTVNFSNIYKNTDTGQIGPITKMYSEDQSTINPLEEKITTVVICNQLVDLEDGNIPAPWTQVGTVAVTLFRCKENE